MKKSILTLLFIPLMFSFVSALSFTASDIATNADGARSVYAADMDGDGDIDIISASYEDDTIAWYENNGAANPSWNKMVIATSADNAQNIFAMDMDGDGKKEVIATDYAGHRVWFLNTMLPIMPLRVHILY